MCGMTFHEMIPQWMLRVAEISKLFLNTVEPRFSEHKFSEKTRFSEDFAADGFFYFIKILNIVNFRKFRKFY